LYIFLLHSQVTSVKLLFRDLTAVSAYCKIPSMARAPPVGKRWCNKEVRKGTWCFGVGPCISQKWEGEHVIQIAYSWNTGVCGKISSLFRI
jgi:hypothetical protein